MGKRFEDLNIFKEARKLNNDIYSITKREGFRKDYPFVKQIRSAALSIISNIGEGHERKTNAQNISFLSYAKGSTGEVRAQLLIAMDQGYIAADEYDNLYNHCCKLGAMINNYIKHMEK